MISVLRPLCEVSLFAFATLVGMAAGIAEASLTSTPNAIGYNSWPGGFTVGTNGFGGAAHDGTYAWLFPFVSGASHVLRVADDGSMSMYNGWPASVGSSNGFFDAAYDGTRYIWALPYDQNGIVRLDTTDGTMIEHNTWPGAAVLGTNFRFGGGALVGTDLWICPSDSNLFIKMATVSGAMTGYTGFPGAWTGTNLGSPGTLGLFYDQSYLWAGAYHTLANMILRVNPADGTMTGFNSWPGSVNIGPTYHFTLAAFDGTKLWCAPMTADSVLEVTAATGAMVGYKTWPLGYVGGTYQFFRGVYDGASVFLTPRDANMVVKVDPFTGAMKGFGQWPTTSTSGFVKSSSAFLSMLCDGKSLWLPPFAGSDRIVRFMATKLLLQTGSGSSDANLAYTPMADVPTPVSYSAPLLSTGSNFNALCSDGVNIWGAPTAEDHIMKVSPTGVVTTYSTWPGSFSPGSSRFLGVGFDGAQHVWASPYNANGFVRVDVNDGSMTLFNSWPSGFGPPVTKFIGSVMVDHFMWCVDSATSWFVRLDTTDGSMVGFTSFPAGHVGRNGGAVYDGGSVWAGGWTNGNMNVKIDTIGTAGSIEGFLYSALPAGITYVSSYIFTAGTFDGTSVWFAPMGASAAVSMHSLTNAPTKYDSWPVGWSTAPVAHQGAVFDGRYIYLLARGQNMVRVDPTTGAMTRWGWEYPTGFTWGATSFEQGFYDGTNLWMAPKAATQLIVFTSGTRMSATRELGIVVQDGCSMGGMVPFDSAVSLSGNTMLAHEYTVNPTGYVCAGSCFYGSVVLGAYVWMIPLVANMVVRVHQATGAMTGFNTWPGGSFTVGTNKFRGASYDPVRERLWLNPNQASHVLYLEVNTGTMGYCPNWPTAWAAGTGAAFGSFIEGGDYLWLGPYTMNMVVRVDMRDCTTSGYQSWPSGFSLPAPPHFMGAVFDGDHHGWFVVSAASHVLRMNLWDKTMSIYNNWPATFSSTGSSKFAGGCFEGGTNLWMAPLLANMVVRLHQDTGLMTGFNSWPPGFTLGTMGFQSLSHDGTYVWAVPRDASHVLRIRTDTGAIEGFSNWPTGFDGTFGAALDLTTGSIWVPPRTSGILVQIFFRVTATHELGGMVVSDSYGYSGTLVPAQPIEGTAVATTSFTGYPAGYTCTTNCYRVSLSAGDHVWFLPRSSDRVLRIHKVTGAMTGYMAWPAGVTPGTTHIFGGGAYDAARGLIWMIPWTASHVVTLDVNTGTMGYCATWPTGYSAGGTYQFTGGVVEPARDLLWMSPTNANMVVKVDMRDCFMTGYNSWPGGYSHWSLSGAVYDGEHHVWFPPYSSTHIIKMNVWENTMTAHNSWPAAATIGSVKFAGGAFDGTNIWLAPSDDADMIVSLDKDTDAMTAYNSWPSGYTAGSFTGAFFDGKYVWFMAKSASMILRVTVATNTIFGFVKPSGFAGIQGTAIDFANPELGTALWQATSSSKVIRMTFHTPTLTAPLTPTAAFTGTHSSSETLAASKTSTLEAPPTSSPLTPNPPTPVTTTPAATPQPSTSVPPSTGTPGAPATPAQTQIPTLVPVSEFPATAFVLGTSAPTVEAGGASLDGILVGIQFQDATGNVLAVPTTLTTLPTATLTEVSGTTAVTSWTRYNATHHSFAVSQDATSVSPFVIISIAYQWGSSHSATQTLEIMVIRPRLEARWWSIPVDRSMLTQQQASSAGAVSGSGTAVSSSSHSYYGVRLQLLSQDGSPVNVSASLVIESSLAGGVALNAVSTSLCQSEYPNQKCRISQLSIGVAQTLDFVVTTPSYYHSDLKLNYLLDAPAAAMPLQGTMFVANASTSGSSGSVAQAAVTASPPGLSNQAAGSPIFGFDATAPCLDALLMAWILFLLVIGVLALLALHMARSTFRAGHQDTKSTAPLKPTMDDLELEAKRSEWLNPSLGALLIPHKWISIFIPCHDQCALGHGLSTFSHLMTLMWVAAVLVLSVVGGGSEALPATTTVAVAILTALIAQPIAPLLNFYYFQYREEREEEEEDYSRQQQQQQRIMVLGSDDSSTQNVARQVVANSAKAVIDTAALDNVELDGNEDNREEGEEAEKEEGRENFDPLDDDEQKKEEIQEEEELEDDVVKEKKSSPDTVGGGGGAVGTIIQLKNKEDVPPEEEGDTDEIEGVSKAEATQMQGREPAGAENDDPVTTTGVTYQATPFRKKGHLVQVGYISLSTILMVTLGVQLRPSYNTGVCPAYLNSVLPIAILVDLVLLQPLAILLTYGYRWMVSDPENGQPMEITLHPRDCFVRDEYEE